MSWGKGKGRAGVTLGLPVTYTNPRRHHHSPLVHRCSFLAQNHPGNNSLKLVDSTFRSGTSRNDDWMSTSSRWITPDDVDRFKDEVANSLKKVTFLLMYSIRQPDDNFRIQPRLGKHVVTVRINQIFDVIMVMNSCIIHDQNTPRSRKWSC